VTRCAPMAFNAEGENGPASEDLATDAHDCIMVGSWVHRIQGCGAKPRRQVPLGLFARTSLSSAMPNGPNRKDPMSSRPAARLAPCSMLSRTLRAGVAGAASGILDSPLRAALCRRQVGTKGWPLAVEPRDGPRKEGRKKVPRPRIFSLDSGSPIQDRERSERVEGQPPRSPRLKGAPHPPPSAATSPRKRGEVDRLWLAHRFNLTETRSNDHG
jgi:hypothetical protein